MYQAPYRKYRPKTFSEVVGAAAHHRYAAAAGGRRSGGARPPVYRHPGTGKTTPCLDPG